MFILSNLLPKPGFLFRSFNFIYAVTGEVCYVYYKLPT